MASEREQYDRFNQLSRPLGSRKVSYGAAIHDTPIQYTIRQENTPQALKKQ